MINNLGTVKPGTTLYIPFQTYDSNDPSASVTITGLATTDIEVYKDGSVTQRASDAGYALLDTDGIDFDGTTGIHGFSIDLADNTTANFYEAGSQYWVVIASITVDAATINFIPTTFRIGYPGAILDTTIATLASQTSFTLEEGPADNDALNGCGVIVHDLASAVQVAQASVSGYVGATRTVTLNADPAIFTMAAGDNVSFFQRVDLTYWLGGAATALETAASVVDEWETQSQANPTGFQVNVAQISGDATAANNLEADYDGTGYAKANSTIGTCTTNTDMRGTDNAALASVLGALNDAAAAGDPTNADTAMQYIKQLLNVLIGTTGVTTFPAEAAPANNVSLAEIIRAIHADVTGLNGDAMRGTDGANTTTPPTAAAIRTEMDSNSTQLAAIVADTNELQTDDVPGLIAALNDLSAANVNAQVLDVLNTDTFAEPTGVPAAAATLATKIGYLYMALRNRIDITATKKTFYDDSDAAEWEKDLSDDGTTYSESEGNAI